MRTNSDDVLGGILERQIVQENGRINIMAAIQYHVHLEWAFGIVECE